MKKFCMIIMLAAVLGSCEKDLPQDPAGTNTGNPNPPLESRNLPFDQAVHHSQKAAWEGLGIDHYRYTAESDVGDAYPFEPPSTYVIFPDREPEWIITQAEEDWYDRHFPGWDWRNELTPPTISRIFDIIEYNSVMTGEDEQTTVRYNERYHYVEEYRTFPKEAGIVGGGTYIRITAFEDLRE